MVDDLCGIPQAMQDRAIFGCCRASTWACLLRWRLTAVAPARVSSRKKQKVGSYESYDEFAGGPGRICYPDSPTATG